MNARRWILIAALVATLGCGDSKGGVAGNKGNAGGPFPTICPGGAFQGDYKINDSADAKAIAGCTIVTGELYVSGALTSLPTLTTVGGDFGGGIDLDGCSGEGCEDSPAFLYNSALTSLSVPLLRTVGGFAVNANAVLTSLSFPKLTTVTGGFTVRYNMALEAFLAQAVRDQLTAPPLSTTICGNKNASACQ